MIRLASTLALAGGLAAGAGLMYLLDPQSGEARRARARKRIQRAARHGAEAARERAQDLGDKALAAFNGHRRRALHLPRSRAGKVAVGTLAAAALAGGALATRNLAAPH